MLRVILEIYFGINLLIVGLGIDFNARKKTLEWFNLIIFFLFGLPIITVVYIWDDLLIPLFKALQIKFFWQFYFTDKWEKSSIDVLRSLNYLVTDPERQGKGFRKRIYRHKAKIVFKRNNFEPVEYKTGLEWLETIPKTDQVKVISPDAWINDTDFIKTRITKKQFIQNMKTSAISHAITFEIDKF